METIKQLLTNAKKLTILLSQDQWFLILVLLNTATHPHHQLIKLAFMQQYCIHLSQTLFYTTWMKIKSYLSKQRILKLNSFTITWFESSIKFLVWFIYLLFFKVSLRFDTSKGEPGDLIKLNVKAEPFSKAHVAVIDQSVFLLKKPNELTDELIESQISNYQLTSFASHSPFVVEKRSIIMDGYWEMPVPIKKFQVLKLIYYLNFL